jgi:uncharacterized membrane protein
MATRHESIRGTEVSMASVRERFGGVDTLAALMGMFGAIGVLVFLGSLIGAGAGGLQYQLNMFDLEGNAQEIVVGGMIIALIVVFVSFFAGGWASGRMARYDGGINGLATGVWMLLLVAVFAALGAFVGAEYNAFQRAGLPDWFSQLRLRGDDFTTMGLVSAVLGVVVMFLGAYLGGRIGETYHQRVDAALTDQRPLTETKESL